MPPEDAFELKPGDVLADRFRIEQVLGVGGMGVVASAWHLELRVRVALKVLLPGAGTALSEGAVERFTREASAVSRMRSEYVVRVFDIGRLPDDGPPYMVMEYLVGEDFESLLVTRGRLEHEEAVGYVLQACEGIAEAHSLGIVHRDLKPANLFLTRRVDGSKLVKVVDFGIAKERSGPQSTSLTGPQIALGSPQYMSPEQTRAAADLDASTDVWSLGVCLYEMLTGAPPFDAPSVAEVTANVLTLEPRPPHEVHADIPAALGAVAVRCLQKSREGRFPDVAALAAALEPFAPRRQRGGAARIRSVLGKKSGPNRATSPEILSSMHDDPAPPAPAEAPKPELLAAGSSQEDRAELAPPDDRRAAGLHTTGATRTRRRMFVGVVAALVLGGVGLITGFGWRAAASLRAAGPPAASVTTNSAGSASVSDEPPPLAVNLPQTGRVPTTPSSARATSAPTTRGTKPGRGISRTFPTSEPEPTTVAATAPPATTSAPAPTPPPASTARVVASARVEIGTATNTFGTTSTNVSRAIGPLGERMTACYRAVLPQMSEPVAGSATLHIETDEDGVIVVARVGGGITAPAACIGAAVSGRKLANVDTGRARADVPLIFRAQ